MSSGHNLEFTVNDPRIDAVEFLSDMSLEAVAVDHAAEARTQCERVGCGLVGICYTNESSLFGPEEDHVDFDCRHPRCPEPELVDETVHAFVELLDRSEDIAFSIRNEMGDMRRSAEALATNVFLRTQNDIDAIENDARRNVELLIEKRDSEVDQIRQSAKTHNEELRIHTFESIRSDVAASYVIIEKDVDDDVLPLPHQKEVLQTAHDMLQGWLADEEEKNTDEPDEDDDDDDDYGGGGGGGSNKPVPPPISPIVGAAAAEVELPQPESDEHLVSISMS